jgi:hypothetical protein
LRHRFHKAKAGGQELSPASGVSAEVFRLGDSMPLYRVYLMENGHVWTAVDLICLDDNEAKRQSESLLDDGRDIELWERDRRVAVLNHFRRGPS